jgi:5-methylthioribose kinase
MRRRPDLAAAIERRIERMQVCRACLVHGDFSPKNVLVPASTASVPADGDRPLWVVDAEVAHFGDPAFDTGFMLNHLMLKAIHRPDRRDAYRACALAFWTSYEESGARRAEEPDTLGHLACLMLSRVHGKSRAEYLDEAGRAAAGRLGQDLLFHTPSTLEAAWERLAVGAA